MKRLSVITTLLLFTALRANAQLDSYPNAVAKQILEQRNAEISASSKLPGTEARYLFSRKRWTPGSKVLVAFNGGAPGLHKAIAEQAQLWMQHANLTLDFGYNPATGQFRTWTKQDANRSAHIRIGFSEEGYWSHVGTDSVSAFVPANSASMNFSGFSEQWPNLMPERWKTVVVHEFGHALGLHHGHQHSKCTNEFRWEQGASGEKSVYDVFQTYQGWSRETVDVNLRPVSAGSIDEFPDVDLRSVMYYAMPAQSYIKGAKSPCFLAKENSAISAIDRIGAQFAYPKNATQAVEVALAYAQASAVLSNQPKVNLSSEERAAVQARLDSAIEAKKPLLYIHIQREGDRDIAREMQTIGRNAGFFVPGIENVSRKGLKTGARPQVRFFREVDAQYAETVAKLIADQLKTSNVQIVKVKSLASSVSRNLVEIWLP